MKLDSAKCSILAASELLLHVHSRRAICGLPLCSLELERQTIGDVFDPLKKRNSTFSGEFSIFGVKTVKFESSVDKWYIPGLHRKFSLKFHPIYIMPLGFLIGRVPSTSLTATQKSYSRASNMVTFWAIYRPFAYI